MRTLILGLSVFFCLLPLRSQTTAAFLGDIPMSSSDFIGYDKFGYSYHIAQNVFSKQKSGTKLQYQNISLGKLSRVDLQNPLNLVLFYEDLNAVVLLDNQLNETRRILFSEHPQPLVIAATGNASQNRLWAYNNLTQELGLYDYLRGQYKVLTQQLLGPIKNYSCDFNTFYWIDSQNNAYSCTVFGKITFLGKAPESGKIQWVSDNTLLYLENGQLYRYTLQNGESKAVDIGKKTPTGFWYGQQNLAIFTSEGISNYKINLP